MLRNTAAATNISTRLFPDPAALKSILMAIAAAYPLEGLSNLNEGEVTLKTCCKSKVIRKTRVELVHGMLGKEYCMSLGWVAGHADTRNFNSSSY